jgi:hypothetical protein
MASPEGRNDEGEKGRDGESVVYSPILGLRVLALQKDRESFFSFLKQLSVSFRI